MAETVRPVGLPVRSLRTASPKPTDSEFELDGLTAKDGDFIVFVEASKRTQDFVC